MNTVNEIFARTLHIDYDDVPWVQNRPGVKNRVLQARPEENLVVTQSLYDPGSSVALHRHLAPVFAITRRGAWSHTRNELTYTPGTYVYEAINVLHQFHNGPDLTEALFINTGAVEFVDPATKDVISRETPATVLARYYEKCEAAGLPRPNLLR